jgi:hypothetical protein
MGIQFFWGNDGIQTALMIFWSVFMISIAVMMPPIIPFALVLYAIKK